MGESLGKATRPATYLQRSFKAFVDAAPSPVSARGLAAMLRVEVGSAYNYIKRLKRMKKIEQIGGGSRSPTYKLVDGATRPPDDARGRKPSRPATAVSQWKRVSTP